MDNQRLLVIDGFNLLSRAYFATSYQREADQLEKNKYGKTINGMRVFLQKTYQLIARHNISHLVICWDVKREETTRRLEYSEYKATRHALPEPLIEQYESLSLLLPDLGISQLAIAPYEADDVIGALTERWSNETSGHGYIYSNDRDLLQLLNSQTTQIVAKKKEEIMFTETYFKTLYNITPKQWIDVKALLGDPSDNIPGVPGVGEKSALPLIQQYQSVESLYQALPDIDPIFNRYKKKLIAGEEHAKLSKKLVTIDTNIEAVHAIDLMDLQYQQAIHPIQDVLLDFGLKIKIYQ